MNARVCWLAAIATLAAAGGTERPEAPPLLPDDIKIDPNRATVARCDGSQLFRASGGSEPYVFSLGPTAGDALRLEQEGPGSARLIAEGCQNPGDEVTVRVADAMGAAGEATVVFDPGPNPLRLSPSAVVLDTCDASVVVEALGGTPPYLFGLEASSEALRLEVIRDDAARVRIVGCSRGSQRASVGVRDSSGFAASAPVEAPATTPLALALTGEATWNETCDTHVRLFAQGGAPPYRFALKDAPLFSSVGLTDDGEGSALISLDGCVPESYLVAVEVRDVVGAVARHTTTFRSGSVTPLVLNPSEVRTNRCGPGVGLAAHGGAWPYDYRLSDALTGALTLKTTRDGRAYLRITACVKAGSQTHVLLRDGAGQVREAAVSFFSADAEIHPAPTASL